jgi:hypothetical protein
MKCITHEGLVYHHHTRYTWSKGKREYLTGDESTAPDTLIELKLTVFPPPMLCPVTWKRYDYTVDDAFRLFDKVDVSYVWQLVLVLMEPQWADHDSLTSAIRSTFQSMFQFLFISRRSLITAYVEYHKPDWLKASSAVRTSNVCLQRSDHKPCLPKVQVQCMEWQYWVNHTPAKPPTFQTPTRYPKAFEWRDVMMVPLEYDPNLHLVNMMRVISKTIYDSIPVLPKRTVVTLPILILLDSHPNETFVLIHEGCWLHPTVQQPLPKPSNKRKRAHPP